MSRKSVVSDGRKYIGRFTWSNWDGRSDAARVGYCFVNGKGREYLRNYRLVKEAAIREMRECGIKFLLLPYKKSEDARKLKFVRYLLRPVSVYSETESHIFFLKRIGG